MTAPVTPLVTIIGVFLQFYRSSMPIPLLMLNLDEKYAVINAQSQSSHTASHTQKKLVTLFDPFLVTPFQKCD
jgi:hypothetical protein